MLENNILELTYVHINIHVLHCIIIAGTKVYHRHDQAEEPLFTWVAEDVLERPTYRTFIKLLDNYETGTGVAEVVTAEEEQENWAFINSCMETKAQCIPIQSLYYLFVLTFLLEVQCNCTSTYDLYGQHIVCVGLLCLWNMQLTWIGSE